MEEQNLRWYWRAYNAVERVFTGAVIGWFLNFPVMLLLGAFSEQLGPNGFAGDYGWYATIPSGIVWWYYKRRGLAGGWFSRASFGAVIGLGAGAAAAIGAGGLGETVFALYIVWTLGCVVVWPVLMYFLYPRPRRI